MQQWPMDSLGMFESSNISNSVNCLFLVIRSNNFHFNRQLLRCVWGLFEWRWGILWPPHNCLPESHINGSVEIQDHENEPENKAKHYQHGQGKMRDSHQSNFRSISFKHHPDLMFILISIFSPFLLVICICLLLLIIHIPGIPSPKVITRKCTTWIKEPK